MSQQENGAFPPHITHTQASPKGPSNTAAAKRGDDGAAAVAALIGGPK